MAFQFNYAIKFKFSLVRKFTNFVGDIGFNYINYRKVHFLFGG